MKTKIIALIVFNLMIACVLVSAPSSETPIASTETAIASPVDTRACYELS